MSTDSTIPNEQEVQGTETSLSNTLQEMWSLQREVLREMISGFRRLEQSQKDFQSGIAEQMRSQTEQLREASVAKPHPEFVRMLDERFDRVAEKLEQLDVIHKALGEPDTTLQNQLKETQDVVFNSLVETREAVQGDLRDVRDVVQQSFQAATNTFGSQLQRMEGQARESAVSSRSELLDTVKESQVNLQRLLNRELAQLRESVDVGQQDMCKTLDATRQSVESSLQDVSEKTQKGLVDKLDAIVGDLEQVHELRRKVEKSLEDLSREARDVGAVAGRLESSTVLTQELLDEQRAINVSVQERETRNEARQHNNSGVLCYHQGAYDSSVEHFKKALELDPGMAEAYNNLGLSYTEMGENEQASDAFRKALELDPNVGQVYNNLGYLYHRRGELEHAVEMYQRAIQRSSDTSAAYSNLGNALYQLKRVEESVKAWKKAIEIDPSNGKAAAALERLGLESNL
jgi:tetratricopeptide (TPR) repeat protein